MATDNIAISTLGHYAGLLAIELDPQRTDFTGTPPAPLGVAAASALAGHLAKDLNQILDGIEHLGLVLPGALYDQTEILQPGFPLITALADVYRGSLRGGFTPQLMALGADDGYFPVGAISPQCRPGSGPLLLLPFCFVGVADDLAHLARIMEDSLLQNGEVSLATREAMQQAFGLTALNMSFATIGDLCALLRVQLDGNGLLPLWELLEQAWFERPGVHSTILAGGNRFLVADDHAHTLFYTFDDWAQFGPGRGLSGVELGAGYRRWARLQRQYTMALEAYGLHVRWVLANPQLEETLAIVAGEAAQAAMREIPCLSGDYLVEAIFQNDSACPEQQMTITNHADVELGTLAYTVMSLDADGRLLRLEHHYPLRPQGLNVIIDRLIERCAEQETQRQVLHPGQLLYSENGRSLRAATAADLPAPAPTERMH
ncbi:MAG: hypothetical protein H6974_04045 [Gammaproteobacteria bacterium]|nr:hypothetical protein [Gammaproteobacteria bacterium]MCP5195952.1 hypothetical protein [Gammaproteobacteria bacterium]